MDRSIVSYIKRVTVLSVLLFAAFCAFPRVAHAAEADTFAGSTYFETAAMQAEAAFPDSDFAVLVGTGWRDALAGSSLAGVKRGRFRFRLFRRGACRGTALRLRTAPAAMTPWRAARCRVRAARCSC